MAKFYSISKIRAENGKSVGRIDIYGEISSVEFWGDEKTPSQFIKDLNEMGPVSEIDIHIFSNGGDPFAALAIYAEIKRRPEKVNVYIDGIAASAATLILCAGETVYMDETSMLMVHHPYQFLVFVGLNAKAARELAAELEKITEPMITAYMKKSGKTREEVIALMDGESGNGTWLTAAEAIEFGLANAYTPETKKPMEAAAKITSGVFNFKGCRIDLSMFDKAEEMTANIINNKTGGKTPMAFFRKNKPSAKVKPKAEIVFVEMVCPGCGGAVNMNPETGEVIPGNSAQTQPDNGDGTAPTLARRMPGNVKAAIYSVSCPHCGEGFVWDTDANADGDEGAQVTEATPLGGSGDGEAQSPAPAPAQGPATAAGKRAAKTAVKPKAELAQSTCPECGAQFNYDTAMTEKGTDAAGTEGYSLTCPECGAQYIEPLTAASPDAIPAAIPAGTTAQAAYRMGVLAERNRMLALDNMEAAVPSVGNMIAAAKRSGASVATMSQNTFQALAKNPNAAKAGQYIQALSRDVEASGVNNLRMPQHHNKQASFADSVFNALDNR